MGTMFQIRNLINRRNVTRKPKGDVNASEDFLEVVVIGYILAAVMSYLGMSSFDDLPLPSIVSHSVWMEEDVERRAVLSGISRYIIEQHVDLETVFKVPEPKLTRRLRKSTPEHASTAKPDQNAGRVTEYSREVLSLGLIFLEFKDAVREGDGDRVFLIWKYLLMLFKASQRKNYAIEALTMLSQYHLTLPPNLAEQVKWSRFVNVHGLPGCNISCDLHMEHINRLVKTAINGLGANKSEKAITRVGRAIGVLASAIHSYDDQLGVPAQSGKHSTKKSQPKILKDLTAVVDQLLECDVFDQKHRHTAFPNLKANLMQTLDENDFKKWMVRRFALLKKQQSTSETAPVTEECRPVFGDESEDEEFRAVFGESDEEL